MAGWDVWLFSVIQLLAFASSNLVYVSPLLCPDVNECLNFGTCSQLCNNTQGSYMCTCAKNFMKTHHMCKAEGTSELG